ncbi:MAG: Gfo/Idh/MocA family oxidoreductase [Planctomycetia bacterium]|nr:Gfo/Idh/MocA family oxidoreductase [Planctomycetia bacterium]
MSRYDRRRFLEDSMFAATAAIAAGSAGNLFGADAEKKEAAKEVSANDKLNVAVVGVNGRGGSHIGGYTARKDTPITWIVDADEAVGQKRVDAIAKKQGFAPKFTTDIRKALEDKELHCVSIATPNHWHALGAIWSIQAGKDVYVEKPVSHNVSEGRRIVEAARKYNKICQTGTQCRSMVGTREAIEYVKAGKIGDVKLARGLCYKSRKSIGARGKYQVPASVDYNLWAGPAPMSELTRPKFHYDWHWQWECGNGDLGNQGIHQVDIARWGLGVSQLSNSVMSYGGRVGYVDAGETANTQVCDFNYGDKSLVFEVRGLTTEPYRGAGVGNVFHGSQGYVVLTSYDTGAAFDLEGKKIVEFQGKGEGNQGHFDNFVDAVRARNHKLLTADIEEGHLSSALCHLANISLRLGTQMTISDVKGKLKGEASTETYGRFVKHLEENQVSPGTEILCGATLALDPAAEKFVNNAAADALLTREYRAPFTVPAAGQV